MVVATIESHWLLRASTCQVVNCTPRGDTVESVPSISFGNEGGHRFLGKGTHVLPCEFCSPPSPSNLVSIPRRTVGSLGASVERGFSHFVKSQLGSVWILLVSPLIWWDQDSGGV